MQITSFIIVRKDLRGLFRDHTATLSLFIIWLLLVASGIMTYASWFAERQNESKARLKFRRQWEQQHINPHDAAHYGTFLFKPATLLSFFDPGLNDYFGSTYRVEAHKQNELSHVKVAESEASPRFGSLSFSLILQFLVPLLLFYVASSSITGEKESGTWRMLLAHGASPAKIIWQKVWANYLFALVIILPLCLAFSGVIWLSDGLLLSRFLFLTSCYLIYYLVVVIIGVLVSGLSKHSGNALITVLMIWLLIFVLLPSSFTTIADSQSPLMSRATFKNNVEQGYKNGLNGHDPYYKRGERNVKDLLAKYHADSLSQLPVDAAGITMQMNEEYQNMVFEYYYGQVERGLIRQQVFLNRASFLNPYLALKRVSMSACGTDFYQHNDFFAQARHYRNTLISTLNMAVAEHPQKNNNPYLADPVFFKNQPEFNYQLPAVSKVMSWQFLPILALLFWLIISVLLLQLATKWI